MKTTIIGKDFNLTEGLKTAVEAELAKLKGVKENAEIEVKLSSKNKKNKVKMALKNGRDVVRVETENSDMYIAVKDAVGILKRWLEKSKRNKKGMESVRRYEDQELAEMEAALEEEMWE